MGVVACEVTGGGGCGGVGGGNGDGWANNGEGGWCRAAVVGRRVERGVSWGSQV